MKWFIMIIPITCVQNHFSISASWVMFNESISMGNFCYHLCIWFKSSCFRKLQGFTAKSLCLWLDFLLSFRSRDSHWGQPSWPNFNLAPSSFIWPTVTPGLKQPNQNSHTEMFQQSDTTEMRKKNGFRIFWSDHACQLIFIKKKSVMQTSGTCC